LQEDPRKGIRGNLEKERGSAVLMFFNQPSSRCKFLDGLKVSCRKSTIEAVTTTPNLAGASIVAHPVNVKTQSLGKNKQLYNWI
jgi:hypothetical protein